MAAPYHNLRSKLNRAIRAWLIAQNCGTARDILVGFTVIDREKLPLTTVAAAIGTVEHPFTGNYRIRVNITVKGKAVQTKDRNPEQARVNYDDRLARTYDALMQTEDDQTLQFTAAAITTAGRALTAAGSTQDQANNADMGDFTVLEWYEAGFGETEAEDDGCDWRETLLFDAVCCASAVPA